MVFFLMHRTPGAGGVHIRHGTHRLGDMAAVSEQEGAGQGHGGNGVFGIMDMAIGPFYLGVAWHAAHSVGPAPISS